MATRRSADSEGEDGVLQLATRQFLRAVRGGRSQAAFARRAGYRPKSVAAWEAGRRFPTAAKTLRLAQQSGIDVIAAFTNFYPNATPEFAISDDGISRWLRSIRGSTPIIELAQRAGHSRFAVARWLSGKARPRLLEFFALVQAMTGRLADLVSELVPIESVSALRQDQQRRERARSLAVEQPWTEAILRLLETQSSAEQAEYRPGWIAERLGIDPTTEAHCIAELEAAGVVSRRDRGHLEARPLTVHTTRDPKDAGRLKRHWCEVAERRLAAPKDEDYFAYNTMALSQEDLERVRELLRATFLQIRAIVAESRPERAALVNLQLVNW